MGSVKNTLKSQPVVSEVVDEPCIYKHGIPCRYKADMMTAKIEALYKEYILRKDGRTPVDLQFRIIYLAKQVFGRDLNILTSAYSSINMGLGYHTTTFIEETIAFIFKGKPRTISVHMWEGTMEDKQNSIFHNFITGYTPFKGPRRSIECHPKDIRPLHMWASRTNGFEDMLCTMRNLYGKSACQ